jgi:putative aldouronate transport system permease protein
VLPFIHIIGISIAAPEATQRGIDFFWPRALSLEAYRQVFAAPNIVRGFYNSLIYTVAGTSVAMLLTATLSYGLSIRQLPAHRFFNLLVVFTMVFNAGLIPLYLVVRALGLLNSYWSVIFATAINPFFAIILRNFFENIPKELHESAYIDGASEPRILSSVILPLSTPALAAITLFYAVSRWNSFFQALMFINDSAKWPIQVWLRQMLELEPVTVVGQDPGQFVDMAPQSVRMAVVIAAMVPIVMVYPFLQKHFAKGIMLGAVKG